MIKQLSARRFPFGLATAITAVAVVGGAPAAHAATAALSAVYWDTGNQRWRDAATTPYDGAKIATYDYAAAAATFTYLDHGAVVGGSLAGSDLKPNFVYQLKLNGKPSYFWGAQGDDLANERVGFAGRWWLNQVAKATGIIVGGWNSDDAEFAAWKAQGFTDGVYDYVFEGYLLFGCFATDEDGRADHDLSIDSSFHVLWKTAQRTPGPNDSAPSAHTFVIDGASDWYASSGPDEIRSIYAEWEPTRALPGELILPAGTYAVRLFLTEESFHESAGTPSSGSWATVMTNDDVQFSIAPSVPALSVQHSVYWLLVLVWVGATALARRPEQVPRAATGVDAL